MIHNRFEDEVRSEQLGACTGFCVARLVAIAAAALIALNPQSALAAISFSGDVSLNPGVPNSPVMVGNTSIGSLQIDNGSTLASGQSQIGVQTNGIGYATVMGPHTTWASQAMDVGLNGIGRLDVLQGGIVNVSGQLRVGANSSGNGTLRVDGAGSAVLVNGSLQVGNLESGAVGTLEIAHGGVVNATQTSSTIGLQSRVLLDGGLLRLNSLNHRGLISGSGEVNFPTTTSLLSAGRFLAGDGDLLRITGSAQGTLDNNGMIEVDGGEIQIFRQLLNNRKGVNGGEITLRDGTLRIDTNSTSTSQFRNNTGLLAAIHGENHFYGSVLSGTDGPTNTAEIAVTNQSRLIFHDDVSVLGGMFTVFPGSKATLLEDLTLRNGSLLLADIAGSSINTDYGEIEVVGNVSLGGLIGVTLSNGFVPEEGDSFQILKGLGGIEGTLAMGAMPALPNRLVWDLDVTQNQVLLNVVSAPSGDFNLDGVVDTSDYILWRKTTGQSGTGLAADGNGDGQVDEADYVVWSANFGATAGSSSGRVASLAAATVPEPTTLCLVLMVAFAVVPWPNRRARAHG